MTECAILNWVAEKASLRGDAGAEARVKGGRVMWTCGGKEIPAGGAAHTTALRREPA